MSSFLGTVLSALITLFGLIWVTATARKQKKQNNDTTRAAASSAADVERDKIEVDAYRRAEHSNQVALESALAYSARLQERIELLEARAIAADKRADALEARANAAEERADKFEKLVVVANQRAVAAEQRTLDVEEHARQVEEHARQVENHARTVEDSLVALRLQMSNADIVVPPDHGGHEGTPK